MGRHREARPPTGTLSRLYRCATLSHSCHTPILRMHMSHSHSSHTHAIRVFLRLVYRRRAFLLPPRLDPSESAADARLNERLHRLRGFVSAAHLGISDEIMAEAPWHAAQEELRKMAAYRTPRDKLVCILNCCKAKSRSHPVSCHTCHT